MKGNRYFLLSVVFAVGGFVLAWRWGEPGSFAMIASVALGGGHLTNVSERWNERRRRAVPGSHGRRSDDGSAPAFLPEDVT